MPYCFVNSYQETAKLFRPVGDWGGAEGNPLGD